MKEKLSLTLWSVFHYEFLLLHDFLGKTTILYQLKLNEQVTTIPTFGFDVVLQGDAEIMLSKLGPKIQYLAWYLSVYIVIH